MRKIRYILAVAAALLSAAASMAQTDLSLFERELKEKNADVKSISCSFVQYRSMAVLTDVVRKEGDFSFMEPDRMLLAFDDGDYIKMGPKKFEMKTAGYVSSMSISSNPMLKKLSAILSSCVSADLKKMTEGFDMELTSSDGEWTVRLRPRSAKAAARMNCILIVFDRGDMSLKELKMEEASGDYTRYEFYGKEYNKILDDRIFNVD